ncbi:TPA: DUF4065 domain-containing protein [Clostridioides difficile]|uniref:DUF4065 domain-containing protein n=1 Tax=Clostridioides difficile TaxID=1496 RepID=A0AAN5VM65_CLODI|nr:type II toxin-antitoxin system antitoxin SocA domain-containing protein [Clostridioides difficile]EGT3642174.1 DUF4065 domain-containing protein [Clostridioides difficile]MBH7168542.1 DUF4065 domain-containing protein [Clostridioides difficile]MBH7847501.1 DUF4065 domain-containing protein [Clostridioides difficile]MBY1346135.1 DUF4065 domain-containing protein [Clostridioides difficile]MBY1662197.1 DUF4065 domain-containing protein [Clostridioides difficile]
MEFINLTGFCPNYDAMDVAEYILWYCENKLKNPINNSKLQRILYFIQKKYICKFNKLLFDNYMKAWSYGIVIPDVYYSYISYGSKHITGIKPDRYWAISTEEDNEFINKMVEALACKDIEELIKISQQENLWKEYRLYDQKEEILLWDILHWYSKEK